MKYYTYLHRKADTNEIFYIGAGSKLRAWDTKPSHRSKSWNNIFKISGCKIEILSYFETKKESYEHEQFLIKIFKEMGSPLVNISGGQYIGLLGSNNGMFGKQSAMKGRKQTVLGLQSIINRANSPKNRTVFEKLTCPHCGKESNLGNSKRWHFDNCKEK